MAAGLSPDLSGARRHCEAAWPAEGVCAVVKRAEAWRFVPLSNVSEAPGTSFVIDPREWMTLEREALALEVWLIHSHVDGPATLSAWDLSSFTVDGRPLLPGLRLAVLSVRDGRCVDEARWRFAEGVWTPAL
ncbi:MAG: Mov34/MPN/PAD-1 family protein [Myxococcales bacterium]|nr:Mov34/MPN/PAD-1 family protein [Myxococcales bacterium]